VSDGVDPVASLREIAYLLERSGASSFRVRAFRAAAGIVAGMDPEERAAHQSAGTWTQVPGLGSRTAGVIGQSLAGQLPQYLVDLRSQRRPLAEGGDALRTRLRGDLHTHSDWSDGTVSLAEMIDAAGALGHEYLAITDHSPRLLVANGLSADRLERQLAVIDDLNRSADVRVLRGIEVDILPDGRLDQEPELLGRLEVVVASVHSRLRMDAESMTRRMVAAIADPHTNVLGHVTGRLVTGERGTRPPSRFDAEVVFEACRVFDVAVELNCRPERRDPPDDLLALAVAAGCLFALDTDAHAPGQLEFLDHGAARAEQAGIPADRIVTTWPVDRLLEWTRSRARP